jgi:hypothetical protein
MMMLVNKKQTAQTGAAVMTMLVITSGSARTGAAIPEAKL